MKFEIGEIAILCKSDLYPERIGEECEVVGVKVFDFFGDEMHDYAIMFSNIPNHYSGHWVVSSSQLKKKKPPKIEVGSFESSIFKKIGWNPLKQKATENE